MLQFKAFYTVKTCLFFCFVWKPPNILFQISFAWVKTAVTGNKVVSENGDSSVDGQWIINFVTHDQKTQLISECDVYHSSMIFLTLFQERQYVYCSKWNLYILLDVLDWNSRWECLHITKKKELQPTFSFRLKSIFKIFKKK